MPWVLEFAGVQPNVGQGGEGKKQKKSEELKDKEKSLLRNSLSLSSLVRERVKRKRTHLRRNRLI